MQLLFALTLFASAALLFCVQPLIAKMVLPYLGGTPAVWNTCTVFFQGILLAGYLYAHLSTAWLGVRLQALVHAGLLALPFFVLPVAVAGEEAARSLRPEANPVPWLLGLLTAAVGLPFFVLSTTGPLLQKWFAATDRPGAKDPYFLYAASNLGSMLALLGYPFLVEPNLPLADQSRWWAVGYGVFAALTVACAAALWLSRRTQPAADSGSPRQDQTISSSGARVREGHTTIPLNQHSRNG